MRKITGRVRPFGQGTKPLFVEFEWPETLDEVEQISDRVEGDVERDVLCLAAKKAMITVQDYVRDHETFEDQEAPAEENADAWAALQNEVESLVSGATIDAGTFPGETKSGKDDQLTRARKDENEAQELIDELRARHGLE